MVHITDIFLLFLFARVVTSGSTRFGEIKTSSNSDLLTYVHTFVPVRNLQSQAESQPNQSQRKMYATYNSRNNIGYTRQVFLSQRKTGRQQLFVGWLLNVPATCECILGTDLLRQFYVLPH